MKHASIIPVFICAALIFVAFFLPWASVDSSVKGFVSKAFKSHDASLMKISGYQVPILANRPDSHLMITIIKLFNPGITDADKKSWLIWAVPLFAVLLAVAYIFFKENKWFNLGVGLLGFIIFAGGAFEILTTDLNKLVMKVTIVEGVWLTLAGYFGIGLVCCFKFIQQLRST